MAKPGAKPKPAHLRVVDGTHRPTRHGDEAATKQAIEKSATSFGKLTRPKYLKGTAADAWKKYIEPAGWLDASREPSAIVFCELWQEFVLSPTKFPASRLGQLRAYMSELGLTDERNRALDDGDKEKDEHFD